MPLDQLLIGLSGLSLVFLLMIFIRQFFTNGRTREALLLMSSQLKLQQTQDSATLKEQLQELFANHRSRFEERQFETLKILQDTLQKGVQNTENKLMEINNQVEKRLTDGFVKTNETFNNVIERLALIDAAQKQITTLSNHVVGLQEILNDKRSRGAFGEVQLSALIQNMIPEQHYTFQHTLSNGKRPDCMLFLPEPTGNIAIDAKFPLENFRLLIDSNTSETDRIQASRQFKADIKKHIQDIAEKYIVPGETSDGAVMFIPSESVFAEIHGRHTDLVEHAQKSKVWLVSPTTMMAILTTARAVLKDAATRKQVLEIQKHLHALADDFERFQMRMDNLGKRIAQAHTDVEQIHISSRKISQRFVQIERAEFREDELTTPIIVPVENEAI